MLKKKIILIKYVLTSLQSENIESTLSRPRHNTDLLPGSTLHRPSRRPHSGAGASGKSLNLTRGTAVAVDR